MTMLPCHWVSSLHYSRWIMPSAISSVNSTARQVAYHSHVRLFLRGVHQRVTVQQHDNHVRLVNGQMASSCAWKPRGKEPDYANSGQRCTVRPAFEVLYLVHPRNRISRNSILTEEELHVVFLMDFGDGCMHSKVCCLVCDSGYLPRRIASFLTMNFQTPRPPLRIKNTPMTLLPRLFNCV
jgi:hypothetical protein